MVAVGDRVYFIPAYQRLLYFRGYESALLPWRVVDITEADRIKVEPDCTRKTTTGHLVVPCQSLSRASANESISS